MSAGRWWGRLSVVFFKRISRVSGDLESRIHTFECPVDPSSRELFDSITLFRT